MSRRKFPLYLLLIWSLVLTGACEKRGQGLIFGGGPSGGTFQTVAEGLARLVAAEYPELRIDVRRSGGSFANLTAVEKKEFDLGLVYSGELFLDGEGEGTRLPGVKHVRSLTRLYGAVAQLAVQDSSRIRMPTQLRGARVAVGNPGSGAALAAERYFRSIDLWDKITPVYLGYSMALQELINGRVEAVWELVGVPSEGLRKTAGEVSLRLLNLQELARNSGFFSRYPFYQPAIIPTDSYPGQHEPVATFEDAALLVGHENLENETVDKLLEVIVTAGREGVLTQIHPALTDFDHRHGRPSADFPLHKGAFDFWRNGKDQGSSAAGSAVRPE